MSLPRAKEVQRRVLWEVGDMAAPFKDPTSPCLHFPQANGPPGDPRARARMTHGPDLIRLLSLPMAFASLLTNVDVGAGRLLRDYTCPHS